MMSRRNRYLFALVAGMTVLALVGAQYIKMVLDEQADKLKAEQALGSEHAQAQNITLTETENGQKRWEITTEKADYDPKLNFSDLDKLTGKVYQDGGDVQFEFKANKGRYYKDKKSFELFDGAELTSPTSKILVSASKIIWPSSKANIQALGGVSLTKPGKANTTAGAATFSQDFKYVEFSGGVTTHISH